MWLKQDTSEVTEAAVTDHRWRGRRTKHTWGQSQRPPPGSSNRSSFESRMQVRPREKATAGILNHSRLKRTPPQESNTLSTRFTQVVFDSLKSPPPLTPQAVGGFVSELLLNYTLLFNLLLQSGFSSVNFKAIDIFNNSIISQHGNLNKTDIVKIKSCWKTKHEGEKILLLL